MNILDIVFIILLFFFLARGLMRGLLMELASIGGLLLGFYAANHYRTLALPLVRKVVDNPDHATLAAYVLVFLAVMAAVTIIVAVLRHVLKVSMLSWADHLLGGVLGFLKGALLSAIIVLVLTMAMPGAEFVQGSLIRPHLTQVSDWMSRFLPEDLKDDYQQGRELLLSGPPEPLPLPELPDRPQG